ncbi:MAG: choice-of-anchor Q domain-containing protein [Kofleriaceae bacterium]
MALAQTSETRNHVVLEPSLYYATMGVGLNGLVVHGNGSLLEELPGAAPWTLSASVLVKDVTVRSPPNGGTTIVVRRKGVVFENVSFDRARHLRILGTGGLTARKLRFSYALDPSAILVEPGGELVIDGAVISGGKVGIEAQTNAKIDLKNVLIWGTSQRALELSQAIGEVSFSTIADAGATTASPPCAMSCNPNVRVTSSIVWQPSCASGPGDAAGPCTFQSSIVSNGPTPGAMNVDPRFVNPSARDYHLEVGSPARDAVDSGPPLDFEGDPRPRGARFDLGADEAP